MLNNERYVLGDFLREVMKIKNELFRNVLIAKLLGGKNQKNWFWK